MCAAFTPEEETLYAQTQTAVEKRLRRARGAAEWLTVLRETRADFDRAWDSAPATARAQVACAAGCDACCHIPVGAQAHEVLILAEHVLTHFSPVELEALIARAAAHRAAFAGKDAAARLAARAPCVLLRDGRCTVYAARPEVCRAHHSPNAAACSLNLSLGREAIDVAIPGLRARLVAVMLAIDEAVREAGFDGESYDLGSALHEALTNSLPARRWGQRQAAFPPSCQEAEE